MNLDQSLKVYDYLTRAPELSGDIQSFEEKVNWVKGELRQSVGKLLVKMLSIFQQKQVRHSKAQLDQGRVLNSSLIYRPFEDVSGDLFLGEAGQYQKRIMQIDFAGHGDRVGLFAREFCKRLKGLLDDEMSSVFQFLDKALYELFKIYDNQLTTATGVAATLDANGELKMQASAEGRIFVQRVNGEVDVLGEKSGLILGTDLFEGTVPTDLLGEVEHARLLEGDRIIIPTDGVADQLFGKYKDPIQSMVDLLRQTYGSDVSIQWILDQELKATAAQDDITLFDAKFIGY